jgi:hypothetical protein
VPKLPAVPVPKLPALPVPKLPDVPVPKLPDLPVPKLPDVPVPKLPFLADPVPKLPAAALVASVKHTATPTASLSASPSNLLIVFIPFAYCLSQIYAIKKFLVLKF